MPNGRHEPSAIEHDPSKARREALSAILLLLLVLLILLLIAAATERTDILRFAGAIIGSGSVLAFQPRLSPPDIAFTPGSAAESASLSATAVAQQVYDIDPLFQSFYDQQNGASWFGRPISPLLDRAGQRVQWFERGRLEYTAGPDGGQVQAARVGVEYLAGRTFPVQAAFADRAGARYFAQTQHGIVEPFLAYWEQLGGVATLGYPISEQLQQTLDDGTIHTVQYFERGRVEQHAHIGAAQPDLRLGALGSELYPNPKPAQLIEPARPTPVPAP